MPGLSQRHVDMLVRLIVPMTLGALVGYERERIGKPAGVRTHGMVALGAALFTLVSVYGFGGGHDPARVAAQIVTGIGSSARARFCTSAAVSRG